ncbi:hypothetical protein ACY3VL_004106 [Enterobacter hormaechei]|uniref:hypothetical protein n=1 Tax=Klebsiella pneumoniae TaxID=573 RepID=UPI0018DD7E00|nr:hypothetical protein [Klebsiella pneumoniae]MBH8226122.1 hypothetical protein [Klebsiella pneumoniae]
MADWFIATEGVKVVKDSASLWPQIITAVSSASAALVGVWHGQWRITRREKEAVAAKLASERLFIATELIFMLERYASEWRYLRWNELSSLARTKRLPVWNLSASSGDWRVLTPSIIFRIRSVEAEHIAIMAHIDRYKSSDNDPHDLLNDVFLYVDCYQTAIKAFMLAGKLRREVGLSDSTNLKGKDGILQELRAERRRHWTTEVRLRRSENMAFESLRFQFENKESSR